MPTSLSLARTLQTIRHLRPEQVADRLTRGIRARMLHRKLARLPESPFPGLRQFPAGPFVPPAIASRPPQNLRDGHFTFVNKTLSIGWPPDWEWADAPALWRYHLHYGDELWTLSPEQARYLVTDWIKRYRPAVRRIGWDAYPTSVRLMNWMMVLFGRDRDRTLADAEFCNTVWQSIRTQIRLLTELPERHLLANHLLENAAALAFAGSCFTGPEPDAWRRLGLNLLRAEMAEQVLADGVHFERSPMYQCRILQVLLNLQTAAVEEMRTDVSAYADRMAHGLVALTHPDGRIALLNDSAFDAYPSPRDLLSAARGVEPEPGPIQMHDSGFFGYRSSAGGYLIANAGRIRPDYFPAHAHADLFSFEWSLAGKRIITDTGVHDYERSALRAYCRSTAAHNTVEIDGLNQSDVWAAFRVGKRARPHDVRWEETDGGLRLSAWHDGYLHTPGRARHTRVFTIDPDRSVRISDRINARRTVSAASRLHFAPECMVEPVDEKRVRVTRDGLQLEVRFTGEGRLRIDRSPYFAQFYSMVERPVLIWQASGSTLACDIEMVVLG